MTPDEALIVLRHGARRWAEFLEESIDYGNDDEAAENEIDEIGEALVVFSECEPRWFGRSSKRLEVERHEEDDTQVWLFS